MLVFMTLLAIAIVSAQQVPPEGISPEQPPIPPFLQHATPEARQQFFSIAYNPTMKIADINEKLEQWAAKQPKDVQDAYNDQVSQQKKLEALVNQKREELVKALPADVQAVAKKLDAIRVNLQLTPEEQMKQVSHILQEAGAKVRGELNGVDQKLGEMLQQQQMKQ